MSDITPYRLFIRACRKFLELVDGDTRVVSAELMDKAVYDVCFQGLNVWREQSGELNGFIEDNPMIKEQMIRWYEEKR
jgi:hypothetical protein